MIPLRGDTDSTHPKAPSLQSWKAYQDRLPTLHEVASWFRYDDQQAIGLVLGKVSGIVVIDIDDPVRAQDFVLQFPDLLKTFTVLSGNRRLPHYYFAISQGMTVPSMAQGGVELRSDGHYVVAPHMVIDNKLWQVIDDSSPRMLTEFDLSRLIAFIRPPSPEHVISGAQAFSAANNAIPIPDFDTVPAVDLTSAALVRWYRSQAVESGRNNALFTAARFARDCGWTQQEVEKALVHVHMSQPAHQPHRPQSQHSRRMEAIRTITSVFSRPAAPLSPRQKQSRQLPNAVREKLLQKGLDNAARVLDGLFMVGFVAGQQITATQVYQKLKPLGIGRNLIYDVLKTELLPDDPHPDLLSPRTPHSSYANAAKRSAEDTKQCLFGRVAKPGKTIGRPLQIFTVPGIAQLCRLLGVKNLGSDELSPEDIRTPAAYRAALHAALLRRAPGLYPRSWLAQRLGVSKDSCRRYEKIQDVEVVPTYQTQLITWSNVGRSFGEEIIPGTFLEDENGKRYPPLVDVARRLLAGGKRLFFRRQDANYYRLPGAQMAEYPLETPATCADLQPGFTLAGMILPEFPAVLRGETPPLVASMAEASTKEPSNPVGTPLVAPYPAGDITAELDAVANTEVDDDLAEIVYQTLCKLDSRCAMTRKRATELVGQYTVSLVRKGLRVLQKRTNIRNPSGFLITWLRSETRWQTLRPRTV